MTTPALKFGCQTFTWEMLGASWTGGPDDLFRAVADGGYAGIEITDTMIGAYAGRPAAFGQRLADAGLQLISFAFGSASGFAEPDRIPAELEAARLWVDYAAHVPGALVSMGSATVMSGGACDGKFGVAAEIYNLGTEIGWIVVEEESQTAAVDPATAVRANLATLRRGFAGGSAP